VVERNQKTRAEVRDAKIREYFYGLHNTLYPHTFEVKFSEVQIFKIGREHDFSVFSTSVFHNCTFWRNRS